MAGISHDLFHLLEDFDLFMFPIKPRPPSPAFYLRQSKTNIENKNRNTESGLGIEMLLIQLAKFVVLIAITTIRHQNMGRAHKLEPESNPPWAKTVVDSKESKTELQFYLHEAFTGESPTTVQVVPAPRSNQTFTGFGYIAIVDDPLRVGPDPKSKMVGRAQGLDGGASRPDGLSLITAVTYTFSDGIYNGSSLSVLGLNPISNPVRELPVVGGTGVFRMARGYALIHTYSFDTSSGIVILGFNVTVLHQ